MFQYGADPEFFILRNGSRVPVCGLIGGTKEAPRHVSYFGLQEDNVMVEFTIPPSADPRQMYDYVQRERQVVARELEHRYPNQGYAVATGCTAAFSNRVILDAGEAAMRFGCSPDFDAYNMGARIPPIDPETLYVKGKHQRFAGGHLHIGYKADADIPEYVVAMFCDAWIGLNLVRLGEKQGPRRALYGSPGRYRPTPYGLEYRTPSNLWCTHTGLAETVITNLTNLTTTLGNTELLHRVYNEAPWQDVQRAITTENSPLAQSLVVWFHTNLLGDT